MAMSDIKIFAKTVLICLSLIVCKEKGTQAVDTDPLAYYDVVWTTPSRDHNGSMPIGNGDIGMNVWVEDNGDLLLLLSKTDAWSENGRLLKLGRVRVRFFPNPFDDANTFQQHLRLRQGEIAIKAGENVGAISMRIWVDANHPVIWLEANSPSPIEMQAHLEAWRTGRRQLEGEEAHSAYGLHGGPSPIFVYPDSVLTEQTERIVWFHRNERSIWEENLKYQGMEGFITQSVDPLMNRIFGGQIAGTDMVNVDPTTLKSNAPQKRSILSIHPLCLQAESVGTWLAELDQAVTDNGLRRLDRNRKRHQAWWDQFWNRSWIRITGSPDAEVVARAYTLQRWISACAGRGVFPIKFNGSIFTVDGAGFDADYRRWGGPYWWQNTRLPYWPMLAGGDFDMMMPLFRMYKDMLPLAEHRTQAWFGHGGSFIGETVYFWGMYNNNNYGWERGEDLPVGELTNPYIRREYTASPEILAMMLDYYLYTENEDFLHDVLLPMCDSLLEFWNEHYTIDEDGYMVMYPAQALETFQDARNPTSDTAGLHWVLTRLLDLPEEKVRTQRRMFWTALQKKVPPLPMAEEDGKQYLLPAGEVFGDRGNSENPELYAVFPFRLYGVGKNGLEIGRMTFDRREVQGNNGWRQDDTQAAFLGLTEMAAGYIVERAKNKHEESRFPAFWGPNFDWIPDQDHGGNLMMGLQAMILQADDGKIQLLPAWPMDWDLDFRLHAPYRTIVEGRVRDGQLVDVSVTPESRRKDVIIVESQ